MLHTTDRRALAEQLAQVIDARRRNAARRQFFNLFPDEDDEDTLLPGGSIAYARRKYPRHIEFFEAGAEYRERCFLAANRVGKTIAGAYEMTAHLTGLYPDWWPGRRFKRPIRAWAAGKTNETTRDTIQETLLGEIVRMGARKTVSGTGMIPGNLLGELVWKQGSPDLVDVIKVRHVSGGWSRLGMKSYIQGRGAFEGTAQHVIWGDEEIPADIYGECLIRTATTDGLVITTFTPLEGLTEVVLMFMPEEMRGDTDDE